MTEYYRQLSQRRGWPPSVIEGFTRSVEFFRHLDETAGARSYFEAVDEDGGRWLWEAVSTDDGIVAVKQIEIEPNGDAHCYSWRHLEDEQGFLTTVLIDPNAEAIRQITADTFASAWDPAD